MTILTIKEIGQKLAQGAQLKDRPVCIYGADEPPQNAVPMSEVDRCVARAIFIQAVKKDTPSIYISEDTKDKCCPGGQSYFGLSKRHPLLKYFLSSGTREFMNGAAEYLKSDPETADRFFRAPGKITPLGKYTVVSPCEEVDDSRAMAILLFGDAEQIRNLCGLIHFRSDDIFTSILVPGGASCASFFTYASGMAERAPRNSAYVGPVDPTGNSWFPENYLSLSIPIKMARQMAEDVDPSFLTKRRKIAFPEKRLDAAGARVG